MNKMAVEAGGNQSLIPFVPRKGQPSQSTAQRSTVCPANVLYSTAEGVLIILG